jgi:hypothetical protein
MLLPRIEINLEVVNLMDFNHRVSELTVCRLELQ